MTFVLHLAVESATGFKARSRSDRKVVASINPGRMKKLNGSRSRLGASLGQVERLQKRDSFSKVTVERL